MPPVESPTPDLTADVPTHRSSPRALGLVIWAGTLVLALGAAYASLNAYHHGSADTPRVVAAPPVARPGLSRLTVVDPNDGRGHGVYVWRPDVPETRALPVLYFLHGVPSDPKTLVDGEGLAVRVRDWVAHGGAPFVLAVPDGNGHHRDTEWANAADGSDLVEDRLLREVIPAVEGRDRRDAAHRAIGGFSMGGYGSMNLALRHPDVFGSVISISGYYRVDDPSDMFGGDAAVIAANRPDRNLSAARRVRIFLAAADEEDNPVIEGEPQRFKRLLDAAGIPAVLDVRHGGHDWDYVHGVLPAAFAFLARGWRR